MEPGRHAQALLRAAVKAQGFNIGLNLGESARVRVFPITCTSHVGSALAPANYELHADHRWRAPCSRMVCAPCTTNLLEAQANMASTR